MSVNPLVWATRPAAQNKPWCQQLQSNGYATVDSPLMVIDPVLDAQGMQAIKDTIMALDEFDYLIFVSQNAVAHGVEWIHSYWPQWPVQQQIFAIGTKTAELLSQSVERVVAPQAGMDTQALLGLPEFADVWGKKILILRGRGGLPRLGDALTQAGAMVRYCELYERVPKAPGPDALDQLQQASQCAASDAANPPLIITLFSGETLQNLTDLLARPHSKLNPAGIVVLVPGPRVADMASTCGFREVICAPNASAPAMINALQSWNKRQPGTVS